jgi:hypothetical protein
MKSLISGFPGFSRKPLVKESTAEQSAQLPAQLPDKLRSAVPRARLTIKYYTGNTGTTTKDIDFMINLSKLNNMFPSLVEYNFLESNFDN